MLIPELVNALLIPIAEATPAGDDLEYDPAFIALMAAAQGKPEQQFGETLIPAVEPEWRQVAEQADAVLRRSKDLRAAVLLLRAATHLDGLGGFDAGLALLHGLLERFWADIHPALDADDGDDPTMRLNALAPLADESMVLRDLYDAPVGVARGVGPVRVRDIVAAYSAAPGSAGPTNYSAAQIQGALVEIRTQRPAVLPLLAGLRGAVAALQALLAARTGRDDAIDLDRLRTIGQALWKAGVDAGGATGSEPAAATADMDTPADATAGPAPAASTAARGEILNRHDALQTLDRVIRYLAQAEPGNPAPLLIERAKKLIGVDFFEIMANLAPNALDTIETVTGRRPSTE